MILRNKTDILMEKFMKLLIIGAILMVICFAIGAAFIMHGAKKCRSDYYDPIGYKFMATGIFVMLLFGYYNVYDSYKEIKTESARVEATALKQNAETLERLKIAIDNGYSLIIDNTPVGSLDNDFIDAAPGKYDIIFDDARKQVIFK